MPASTSWPPKILTPSILGFESRPLRDDPPPFLCAMYYFFAALASLVALGSLASLLSLLALVSLVSFFARGLRAAPFLGVSSAASSDSSFLLRPNGRISSAVRSARAPRC